ncbi:MAG TPA: protein kinase [Vicinamibacterales bacterium]
MTPRPDWERVSHLFQQALELAPEARLPFVAARADSATYADVASLLEIYPMAEGFLSTPVAPGAVLRRATHLQPGERLGPFEILGCAGRGGMGEVYRARDTRLGRDVAVKVLSNRNDAADDGERLEREARAIAQLNHPRISTLHDVGSATIDGVATTYLVMELVDGETLAARLRRGPLPLDQALAIACDIAEALVAAHAANIVHRDLKPANVMVTRSGAKLLDFGLARPRLALAGGSSGVSSGETNRTGIVGTLPYMAPEQLRGVVDDARSDLFAFGAVLYEMLTGNRAFDGESDADLIKAVLEHDPPPLPGRAPLVPSELDRIVSTCLAKDPDERWQTARDLQRALQWLRRDKPTAVAPPTSRRLRLPAIIAAAFAFVLGFVGLREWRSAVPPAHRITFSIPAPEGTTFPRGTAEMAVSPDDTQLVFVALNTDGVRRLWVRRFDAVGSRLVEGSEDAHYPFWSPDGSSIAYFTHNKLKRIAAGGGVPQVLCDVVMGTRGGTWNRDGVILFSSFGSPIQRVADTGGAPVPVTELNQSRQELAHAWPVFLPDGKRFLYLAFSNDPAQTALFQGSLGTRSTQRVAAAESNVAIVGSSLVALNKGLLTAHTYDPERLQIQPPRSTMAEGVESDPPLRSGAPFSATRRVVAYRSASPNSRLIWFDRSGREIDSFAGPPGDYHHPALAPDERTLAVEKTDPATGRHTIWTLDFARGATSRLIADAAGAHGPAWSPDGRRVIFSSNRLAGVDLYVADADGTGAARLLLRSPERNGLSITHWPRAGLVVYTVSRKGQKDLAILSLGATQKTEWLLDSAANEEQAQLSPDAKWLAFTSDESGAPEVYVVEARGSGPRRQVSTRGGAQAHWRGDGKELFYLAPDGRLMAVDVTTTTETVETGMPRALFATGITGSFLERFNQFVVTRDGERFLVNISDEDIKSSPITVVVNWDNAADATRRR